MDSVVHDFRYALRSVAGSKKFAAIVIVTLALGIGANTAVFGVLNAVVLRPLPYDEPERLVGVVLTVAQATEPERVRSMPVSADYFRVLGVHPVL